jgi:hypothetical protein
VKKLSNVENISDSSCQGILPTDNMTKISFPDYTYFTTLMPQLSRFPENESVDVVVIRDRDVEMKEKGRL